MIKGIIFDFNRTIYDPDKQALSEGALDILKTLKQQGYKMALMSSANNKEEREVFVKQLGIKKFFNKIITIIEGREEKSIKHFEECAQGMDLPNNQVLAVGDNIKREIAIGNQAGMTTVRYQVGKHAQEKPASEEEKADYVITHFNQLINLLK